ncbi:DNA-directed RNA polymerase III subunit RPC5-like [Watersipora subatra]|uniref:DNA-directed RNA polymerase III subunit RPC5-like n=1 Tax=Watersipora subatra TaxID=2589382 RepID=UPI00355C2316
MDDEVVKEVDVFLTKELKDHLWLMQYPVRPVDSSYDNETFLSTQIKPLQRKVNIDVAIDTNASSYLTSKGEFLASSVDGSIPKGPRTYPSGKLDRIELKSAQGIPKSDRYAIGAIKNGSVHLTPLSAIVQMRPSLSFLDKADAASKEREKLLDIDKDNSQDEEEAKTVTVKFARQETSEQKSRRIKSYDYLKKKESEESWSHFRYHKTQDEMSGKIRHRLLATKHEAVVAYASPSEYLSSLIPKPTEDIVDNPDMPSNVLSMAQLQSMSLNDRVKAIVTNAKVIRWSQLIALLDKDIDQSLAMKAIQQVAVLVQGCWVVKSEVLHPKDTFSAHNHSPAEVICRARDFMLWKFTQSPSLIRRDIAHIVKIPSEELKEMLEQIAKPKPKQGWIFNFEFDQDFVHKNKEVVQRQNMVWEHKYQQLKKHFELTKDCKPAESARERRRRHSSHSKSRSDVNDTDGEQPVPMEVKEECVVIDSPIHNPVSSPGQAITNNLNGDTDGLVAELSLLLREKLLTDCVFTMADMRRIYQTKLAQCPAGHILATGVSESLLEKTVLNSGAIKIHYMNPPGSTSTFYVLIDAGNDLDPVRTIMAQLFQKSNRIKSNTLREELEQQKVQLNEDKIKSLLKDYCTFRAGFWFLKGSMET